MNGSRSHPIQAGRMRLGVLTREEILAEATGLCQGTKAVGEARPVFQGFEGGFRVGVVGGDIRAAVRFDAAEVRPRGTAKSWQARFPPRLVLKSWTAPIRRSRFRGSEAAVCQTASPLFWNFHDD